MPFILADAPPLKPKNWRLTMNKDNGYLWLDREFMGEMARKFGSDLSLRFLILASCADTQGKVDYQKAVDVLAADRDMNKIKARKAIARLLGVGMATEKGRSLALEGQGTSFIRTRASDRSADLRCSAEAGPCGCRCRRGVAPPAQLAARRAPAENPQQQFGRPR